MKILIVDDEILVRDTLRSMLEDLYISGELIDEATNGKELLDALQTKHYDIIFVDIRMPLINGLEAIRQGKVIAPHINWVIISGYSDFQYAQEAIQLGVSSYLLKPINPLDLEALLNTLLEKSNEFALLCNQKFESEIIALYHHLLPIEDLVDCTRFSQFMNVVLTIDTFQPALKTHMQQQLYHQIVNKIKKIITPHIRLGLLTLGSGDLGIVLAWGPKQMKNQDNASILQFEHSLKCLLISSSTSDVVISLISSATTDTIEENMKRLWQVQNLSDLRFFHQLCTSMSLEDLSQLWYKSNEPTLSIIEMTKKLIEAYSIRNFLMFNSYLSSLKKNLNAIDEDIRNNYFRNIAKFIPHIQPLTNDQSLLDVLTNIGETLLLEAHKNQTNTIDAVSQVKEYVTQHYKDNIGINQIAYQLKLSPNYLSALFKKKEGITFMRYLTQVRMFKSKELLSQPGAKVGTVAEAIGFYSSRHFSKLFKEYYGCSPSDYHQ